MHQILLMQRTVDYFRGDHQTECGEAYRYSRLLRFHRLPSLGLVGHFPFALVRSVALLQRVSLCLAGRHPG
jgi:hypothetical protein